MAKDAGAKCEALLVQHIRVFRNAKMAELAAKEARIEAEEKIIALVGFKKPGGGSQTYDAGSPGNVSAKITLSQPLNPAVDEDKIPNVKKRLGPSAFKKVFKIKHGVQKAELADLKDKDRDLWLVVNGAITSTPGKIGVNLVEFVEGGEPDGD